MLVLFSFLLNYPWEMLQIPFFAGMTPISHWAGVRQCSLAAAGDAIISLTAFWIAAFRARSRGWFLAPGVLDWTAYLLTGVAVTILFEELATGALGLWQYSGLMPKIPFLRTGAVPVLQWLLLPPLILWLLRRHYVGSPQL